MRKLTLVLSFCGLVLLPAECFPWGGKSHPKLTGLTVELVANELGADFERALEFLRREEIKRSFFEGSIAPDVKPELMIPPNLHCWEANLHHGFLGLGLPGSFDVVQDLEKEAKKAWESGDETETAFWFGCMMHLTQDPAFCGHSNQEAFGLGSEKREFHQKFEGWVESQTESLSSQILYDKSWTIHHGGLYLKQGWADERGRVHWPGGLEGWVDVAAHLGYDRLDDVRGLNYGSDDFQASARYMFVQAQRAGAGLLLAFLQEVGLVDRPVLCYPRQEEGRVCIYAYQLGGNAKRLMTIAKDEFSWQLKHKGKPIWPQVMPSGMSKISLYDYDDGNGPILYRRNPWKTSINYLNRAFAGEVMMPRQVSHAWYVNNYLVALADKKEGLSPRHLVLLPAIPAPDRSFHYTNGRILEYDSPFGYEKHEFQWVLLPK